MPAGKSCFFWGGNLPSFFTLKGVRSLVHYSVRNYQIQDLPGFAPACDRRHRCMRYCSLEDVYIEISGFKTYLTEYKSTYYDFVDTHVDDEMSNSL